jgi:gluconokinase
MITGHIVVLDIGTTTAKAMIYSADGKTIAYESIPYMFLDRPEGHYEQSPFQVYSAIINATKKAIDNVKESMEYFQPLAVSMVCQGGSVIPCDEEGNPIYPMITWMDSRARKITERLISTGEGKNIYNKTGFLPSPGLPLSMIMWMRENESEVFKNAKKWVCLNDFILKKLTGNFVTNYSSAGLTQLLNVDSLDWDEELLYLAGLRREQLSELKESDAVAGYLLPEVATELGLPTDIPVINGVHDRTAEAIGLGHYNKGDSWIGTGTAWVVCSVIDYKDRRSELTSNFHALKGKRIASNLVGGLGSSVEWWISQLIGKRQNGKRSEVLKELTDLAMMSPIGANGLVFKAFTGSGNEGAFLNETDKHTDADRSRAVYESIAFDFKKVYVEFAKHADIKGKLTLVGGATRSAVWPTIIAEILGIDIEVSQYDHDPALGAAILAGKHLGWAKDYEGVFEIFKTERVLLEPNPEHVKKYEDLYRERKDNE